LFYYAGHGVQVHGANYLVPVDANPTREADIDFQMVDVALILRQMESSRAKLNLVILDACRNNPFAGRGFRATGGGLAQMQAAEGTLIAYATQPGNVAQDGADGNSPYTKALTLTIVKPGLGLFDAFNEVGLLVTHATGGSQQPWLSASPITGGFHFSAAEAAELVPLSPTVVAVPPSPNIDPCAAAGLHWKSTEAIGTLDAFRDHLSRFPNCAFSGLAKTQIDELVRKSFVVAPSQKSFATASVEGSQSGSAQTVRPSFECNANLRTIEQLICGNANLAHKDLVLADLYGRLIDGLSGDTKTGLRNEQRQWLNKRQGCETNASGDAISCAAAVYDERIADLQFKLNNWPVQIDSSLNSKVGPSFNCNTNLEVDEQAVCSNASLARKDRSLAALFERLRAKLVGRSRQELVQAQRDWIAHRKQCRGPQISSCIEALYDQRIERLRSALADP
jgi:uncharacterized protein